MNIVDFARMALPLAVSLLCGVVIPSVTDLVTAWEAPDALKAWIAAGLSALAGALATVTWAPGASWTEYLFAVFTAFVTTFAAHHAGTSKPVKRATARIGIGSSRN